ncbi:uncharacterized protein LOC143377352 [Andrena cerasifolii]|uniref:uncharacterized protein LOC143377352 n=1 Tax=Andrena cerasifolii TaxID=2819439 RepID=UPI004037D483
MHINVCFAILLLAIALAQAGPAPKTIEKKSLAEDTKLETKKADLKIEEAGEDKDRAKKSATTFCVQIKPGSNQQVQVPCKDNQAVAQRMPFTVQSQSVPQQIQAMSLVQPVVQAPQVPQANILVPQPVLPPFNTLQIVQSAAPPCAQSAPAVNIIQSIPQSNIVQHIPKPKPKPKPTSAPAVEIETITETPKSDYIEQVPEPLPEPQETLTMLPYATACQDHLITIPSSPLMLMTEPEPAQLATIIQVPSSCNNPLHGIISPCSCQSNVAVLNEPSVESMSMKMLPVMSYSSPYTRSSLMTPYLSNMVQRVMTPQRAAQQGRTSTHIDVHMPGYGHYHHDHHGHHKHHKGYQNTYINAADTVPVQPLTPSVDGSNSPKGVIINAYPQNIGAITSMVQTAYRSSGNTLRSGESASNNPVASGVTYIQQTNKAPREVDPNQLAPEKVEEIETEKGQALLIDGRRNARSNKEEAKDKKSVSAMS